MRELKKKYDIAKQKALNLMKAGQLNAYFEALIEMNTYKRQLIAIQAN